MYKIVFVYGSLMGGFANHRIISNSKFWFLGHYKVKGTLYSIADIYPALTLGTSNNIIEGQLFLIDQPTWEKICQLEGSLYKSQPLHLDPDTMTTCIEKINQTVGNLNIVRNNLVMYFEATPNLIKNRKPIRFNSWYNYKKIINPYRITNNSVLKTVQEIWYRTVGSDLKSAHPSFYKEVKKKFN